MFTWNLTSHCPYTKGQSCVPIVSSLIFSDFHLLGNAASISWNCNVIGRQTTVIQMWEDDTSGTARLPPEARVGNQIQDHRETKSKSFPDHCLEGQHESWFNCSRGHVYERLWNCPLGPIFQCVKWQVGHSFSGKRKNLFHKACNVYQERLTGVSRDCFVVTGSCISSVKDEWGRQAQG